MDRKKCNNSHTSSTPTDLYEIPHIFYTRIIHTTHCFWTLNENYWYIYVYIYIYIQIYICVCVCVCVSVFVSASHQTGLDSRSMTRRSIIVGIRGGEGRARAEARALLVISPLSAMWAWWSLLDMDPNNGRDTDVWLLLKLDQEVQCYLRDQECQQCSSPTRR